MVNKIIPLSLIYQITIKHNNMNTIIYKGIEIKELENGYYTFDLLGVTYRNTNIHHAKRMVTRMMKHYGLIK